MGSLAADGAYVFVFIFACSQVDLLFKLDLDRNVAKICLFELALHEWLADALAEGPLLVDFALPALPREKLAHVVAPGHKARLEEHLCQEEINRLRGMNIEESLLSRCLGDLFRRILLFEHDFSDLELGH